MPTSSSSHIHLSHRSNQRPNRHQEQQGRTLNNMRPQQELEKASNGFQAKKEKVVKYRECRKNQAASIGGYAFDGCREFMASGDEGTSAALRCAACSCHRNFHKREVKSVPADSCDCSSKSN